MAFGTPAGGTTPPGDGSAAVGPPPGPPSGRRTGSPPGPPPGSPPAGSPPAGGGAHLTAGLDGRGVTRVADRVVEKVAAQAAREALRTDPHAVRLPPGAARPTATVALQGRQARLRIVVELGYPSDIGAQCAAVRRHVASRVSELVGMEVRDVAVGVAWLHSLLPGDTSGRVT